MLSMAVAFILAQNERFPLAEGSTWTFSVKKIAVVGGMRVAKEGTATLKCGAKEKAGGEEWSVLKWTVELKNDRQESVIWARTTADRIILYRSDNNDTPFPPADFKEKKTKASVRSGEGEVNVESTYEGDEDVETPAGKHEKAAKVVVVSQANAVKVTTTTWYAKGVGPVKIVRSSDVGGAIGGDKEFVLKSFEKK